MNEFIEKLIGRLEEERDGTYFVETANPQKQNCHGVRERDLFNEIISIVNELAEEHSHCTLCYLQGPCEYQNENVQMPMEYWESGWIPCSERLPIGDEYKRRYDGETYYKQVLAMTNETEVPMYIGWYDQENERWYDKDGFAFYPIAWQPLPEPYIEK